MRMYNSKLDRIVYKLNGLLLCAVVISILYPLVYILIASFTDPVTLLNEGISFNVSEWTLEGYITILSDPAMIRGFINSFIYSTLFALLSVSTSVMAGYALAQKELVGRSFISNIFVVTMFFGGGLVPTYLLIKSLGMLDTIWAIILPGAVNVWNIILSRTYFQSLPKELIESSKIDGADDLQTFIKIILPLAKPIILVLVLYAFVAQWNSYFDAMIYLKSDDLAPLQLVLRRILIQNEPMPGMISDQLALAELKRLSEMIKYAAIVISSLPLMIMYPFFQKYFEEGVMVGSIKG
ncbi:MAG: carbohydrate ABC transporter permease [Romboutsia timonensis]|uniref:carbohydrate ABC transporter permease n=1 Tax=Romboutsia timonensis TaxID=1776391 RepID=UPI0008D9179D|nr:carbohydrate ABC transporter permease [Romboutsia timonensis]